MSVWTHVAGNIYLEGADKKLLDSLLGEQIIFDYDSFDKEEWRRLYETSIIPKGSEGSLRYKVIKIERSIPSTINENTNYYNRIIIAIWGDLRDYSNTDEIKSWFENIIYHEDVFIRQAVLQVQCMDSIVIEYDGKGR